MTRAERWTTCFGLGTLPWAPGTWGSLLPVVTYQVLGYLGPAANPYVMAFFLLAGSWACLTHAPAMIQQTGQARPPTLVVDRVAGQGLTMLMVTLLAPPNICNSMALAFALFRLFDIFRPWPCKLLAERPSGQGILAPSLMAGLYAGILSLIAMLIFPAYCRV